MIKVNKESLFTYLIISLASLCLDVFLLIGDEDVSSFGDLPSVLVDPLVHSILVDKAEQLVQHFLAEKNPNKLKRALRAVNINGPCYKLITVIISI